MYNQPYGGIPPYGAGPARPGMSYVSPSMPGFNFSAPVIHLGTKPSSSTLSSANLGVAPVQSQAYVPGGVPGSLPSIQEQLNTIFIGNIPKDLEDESMEKILMSAHSRLRRWIRARDALGRAFGFGFAVYAEPDATYQAIEVLKDIAIPPLENGDASSVLKVVGDAQTQTYLDEHLANKVNRNVQREAQTISGARTAVLKVLDELKDPASREKKVEEKREKAEEIAIRDPSVITIPLSTSEELSDVPPEQRAEVAREIAKFRERSNRRELDRMRKEADAERQRELATRQRKAKNVAEGVNNTPLGPRGSGAPSGPAADRRGPKSNASNYSKHNLFPHESEEDVPDEELERRRKERQKADLDAAFAERERRWLNRERSRTSALEREMARDAEEKSREGKEREALSRRLAEWDDDVEGERATEEYYKDRQSWLRHRTAFRAREMDADTRDRSQEDRGTNTDRSRATVMAETFLAQQANELVSKSTSGPIRLVFGNAKKSAEQPKRSMAESEGLLEDAEEPQTEGKRKIVPLEYDTPIEGHMDEETRQRKIKRLVQDIPSDKEGLSNWKVRWDQLDNSIVEDKIQPFATKKIVEYLGVQEDDLIAFVVSHIKKKGTAEDLAKELEMAMDEEAEVFAMKIWRMLILELELKYHNL
ncbi:U1 snRNP-associated protein usp107 [Neolecta irregularis DAH-3]|uniref:U1 snRNP-associated protein usp107 n=1 Tax=Neolecta irregularis (strain DAH-3) TaxID=1198029 RepID=A0A1U7LH13_NEOID|nr:U1 snRNP-associated protein usp107 [Neolecta irregularis DAH-3]|eukprot:OLL21946.1 U1 snRNP-associated protein usp107 [Neolecta irregularis DAH-3]